MFALKQHKSKLDIRCFTYLRTVTLPDVSCLNINFGGARIRTEPLVPKMRHFQKNRKKVKYIEYCNHKQNL